MGAFGRAKIFLIFLKKGVDKSPALRYINQAVARATAPQEKNLGKVKKRLDKGVWMW